MRNLKYHFNKVFSVILILFLIMIFNISAVSAFSDYEKDVADRLYKDLNQKYRITEFREGSLEYETLKTLEKNIIKEKFKNEEFKAHHVDDKKINAYYIGAGNIMLFEGLLQKLNTEDQLAGLIAHEMGHAVEEHLTEDLERNLGLSLLNILFNHFTDNEYQTMTNVAQNLIANGYSRDQEQESDIYAVDLMLRSGYDPQGLIELMQIFKKNSNNFKLLEFTQTHPIPQSRIDYLKEYIAQKKSKTTGEKNTESNDTSLNLPVKVDSANFENSLISFSYPSDWEIKEERVLKREVRFRYQLQAEKLKAEIFLEDLSSKTFMETGRKQFNYAAIEAEENGYQVSKRVIKDDKLDIYQLQLNRNQQVELKYFINQKGRQQLLRLSFELASTNNIQQQKQIENLIDSIKFK
ncbi:M48 family metalloprotease [Halanaerobium sp. ST460_2HS_T2]|uniref:M48 family metalloprotease n=1 Tax=Halanaerobium sp. ST460_2HS_T2 TaxID=2183914 RepID=UPI000DF1E578|nr:M48 family metalloprotease [Halanaerobium sp. ST460_2HS_T2]RCW56211.1 peptidase M48-like protein [Halanaerobium sp. ST460_2HS_T2]